MHFQRSNAWFSLRYPGTMKRPGDAAAAPEGDCVDAGQASQSSTISVTHPRNTHPSEIINVDSASIPRGLPNPSVQCHVHIFSSTCLVKGSRVSGH